MSRPSTEWHLIPAVMDVCEASGFDAGTHKLGDLHGVASLSEGGLHLGAEVGEEGVWWECAIVAADIDYGLGKNRLFVHSGDARIQEYVRRSARSIRQVQGHRNISGIVDATAQLTESQQACEYESSQISLHT